jgi:hypothetical protein
MLMATPNALSASMAGCLVVPPLSVLKKLLLVQLKTVWKMMALVLVLCVLILTIQILVMLLLVTHLILVTLFIVAIV